MLQHDYLLFNLYNVCSNKATSSSSSSFSCERVLIDSTNNGSRLK